MIALAALLAAASAPRAPGPVDFGAQTMRTEPNERRTVLDGSVRLSRDGLVVTGDHAVVEFAPEVAQQKSPRKAEPKEETGFLGQRVERFKVDGNVRVQRGARIAEGAHGVFDAAAQTMELTGDGKEDPVVRDGSEMLSGERIRLRVDTEDVYVDKPRAVLRRSLPDAGGGPLPTRVEASKLFLDKSQQLARFSDDVVVRRGDLTVKGPRMDARYDSAGQLTKLALRGGVELRQGDRRATAQSADYDAAAREVLLTGEPRLFDKGDVLSGERIVMALDSHQVRVERARGRLRPEEHQAEPRGEAGR
jgi:lipopolysaccharide transport protein LptA